MSEAAELVHYTTSAGVATITLDSPHNRNALSSRLRRQLTASLTAAQQDDSVRVIVLEHTGPVFCAGMDLKESRGSDSTDQGVNEFPAILQQLWDSPKPVVAKLRGPARAGGVGMVAAADIAVAVHDATFAFTEVRIGVIPAIISVTVLPRLSARAAHELFLTGETFDATRAADIGLINSAVTADELDSEVSRFVDALSRGGPRALAATKELLREPPHDTVAAAFSAMTERSAEFFASEEGQEGMAAFAEKRSPSWVPGN